MGGTGLTSFLVTNEVDFVAMGLAFCGGYGTNFGSFCDDIKCALRTGGVALARQSPLGCLDICMWFSLDDKLFSEGVLEVMTQ